MMDEEHRQPKPSDSERRHSPQNHDDSAEHAKKRQKLQALREQGIRHVNLMGLQVALDDPDSATAQQDAEQDADTETPSSTYADNAHVGKVNAGKVNADKKEGTTDAAMAAETSAWQPQAAAQRLPDAPAAMLNENMPDENMFGEDVPDANLPAANLPDENISDGNAPEERSAESFAPTPQWQPSAAYGEPARQPAAPEAAIALEPNPQPSLAQRLRLRARQIKVDTAVAWMLEGKLTSATEWFFEVSDENPHDAPGQQAQEQLIAIAEQHQQQGRSRLAISIFERLSDQQGLP